MITFDQLDRIHIELTNQCNAACPNCPRNFFSSAPYKWIDNSQISLEQFKSFFSDEVLKKINCMTFCGNFGEPSLCNDLIEIIKFLSPYNLEIQINTNGSTKTEEFWFNLGSNLNKKSHVVFSIDGLKDTNHLYRKNTSFTKIISNLEAFIRAGGTAIWEMLVFKHNTHQVKEAQAFAKTLGVQEFRLKQPFGFQTSISGHQFMPVLDMSMKVENILHPETENISEVFNRKMRFAFDGIGPEIFTPLDENLNQSLPEKSRPISQNISCRAKERGEIYVDSLGTVFPCCFLSSYYPQQNVSSREKIQFIEYFKKIDKTKISLKSNPLKNILNQSIYKEIEDSWGSTNELELCSTHCDSTCGKFTNLYLSKHP